MKNQKLINIILVLAVVVLGILYVGKSQQFQRLSNTLETQSYDLKQTEHERETLEQNFNQLNNELQFIEGK